MEVSELLSLFCCAATQIIASLASQLTSVLNSDCCQIVYGAYYLQLQRENRLKAGGCGVIRLICVFTFSRGT